MDDKEKGGREAERKVLDRTRPTVIQLAAGTYWWCTCGETAHPPFCDGSHLQLPEDAQAAGPMRWKLDADRKVALCNCKKTANAPLCDGSHGG